MQTDARGPDGEGIIEHDGVWSMSHWWWPDQGDKTVAVCNDFLVGLIGISFLPRQVEIMARGNKAKATRRRNTSFSR
jgi:hypothetical protein